MSPFGLKYTVRRLDSAGSGPYVAAGLDFAVVITHQDPVADESLGFTGSRPSTPRSSAGTVAQAPELTARGYPTGQGNIDFGFHAGGGLEVRLARRASLNVEYRFTLDGPSDAAARGDHRPWLPLVMDVRGARGRRSWRPWARRSRRAAAPARDYASPAEVLRHHRPAGGGRGRRAGRDRGRRSRRAAVRGQRAAPTTPAQRADRDAIRRRLASRGGLRAGQRRGRPPRPSTRCARPSRSSSTPTPRASPRWATGGRATSWPRHMVDLRGSSTVIDLWIELEEQRAG